MPDIPQPSQCDCCPSGQGTSRHQHCVHKSQNKPLDPVQASFCMGVLPGPGSVPGSRVGVLKWPIEVTHCSPTLSVGLLKGTKIQISPSNVLPHLMNFNSLIVLFFLFSKYYCCCLDSLIEKNSYLREDVYAFNFFMIRFLVRFRFELLSVLARFLVSSMCPKGPSQMEFKFQL